MKTNFSSLQGLCLALVCLVLWSCQPNEPTKTVENQPLPDLINPPIPEMVAEFHEKEFQIEKGLTWTFSNGTRIKIPADALVDKEGNPLKGKASLQFRDYHDAVDVFLSGIPMGYDDGKGEKGNMETAGMFELRAKVNGKDAFMKQGEKMDIRLASDVGDIGYNSYYLNEETRQWEYLEANEAKVNTQKVNLKKTVNELRPERVFPLDRKYFALDYHALLDEYFNNKRKDFDDGLMKDQLGKYGLAWLDAQSWDGVVYNGQKQPASLMVWKKLTKTAIPSWVQNGTCEFFNTGGNKYEMKIMNKDETDSTLIKVELVMPVSYLFKLPPEEWANNYQAAFAKFKKEENRMKLMSDFTRSLEAQEFGIYNYDRIMKEDEALILAANFDFKTQFDKNISQPDVYYIPSSERALVKYPEYQWNDFPLMPDDKGLLFSLLPGNKVAVYAQPKYSKIDFDKLRKQETPTYDFEMVTVLNDIKSPADLKKALLN